MNIEINGLKTNYLSSNTGHDNLPTIIFVHGWGGSIESLKELYFLAVRYGYNAYILDLPGFGSSVIAKDVWGVEEYAQHLIDFMNQMGINEALFFGHSFGGGLGAYIAAMKPELINTLVLCAAAVKRSPIESRSVKILKRILPGYVKIKESLRPVSKLYYKIFYPLSDSLKHPELEKNYRKMITQNLEDMLIQIKQPTLILWGDQDRYTPIADGRTINEKIVGSRMVVYEGIGHGLPVKHPQKVFMEIDKFIREKI